MQMQIKPGQFADLPNERYFNVSLKLFNDLFVQIVTEIVDQRHVAKLLKWCTSLTEDYKRGLRLVKTIIDLKGAKKFKRRDGMQAQAATSLPNDLDISKMSAEDAKKVFRKLANTTTHCRTFGEKPTAAADFNILKNKRFSELEISKVLNTNAI